MKLTNGKYDVEGPEDALQIDGHRRNFWKFTKISKLQRFLKKLNFVVFRLIRFGVKNRLDEHVDHSIVYIFRTYYMKTELSTAEKVQFSHSHLLYDTRTGRITVGRSMQILFLEY